MTRAPARPSLFHIAPHPGRWLNDPNGPIHHNGTYHVFHQPNWMHATSRDLVTWRVSTNALLPDPSLADRGGCWSGGTVNTPGGVHCLYTGYDRSGQPDQVVMLATADDDTLATWTKNDEPVIASAPEGLELLGFRDPYVFRHGDEWLCVMGAGTRTHAMALLFKSADLRHWRYVGPLYERANAERDPLWSGQLWECPQFFDLDGVHVLGASVWYEDRPFNTVYFAGDFDGSQLHNITATGVMDHGPDFYAPTSMRDDSGRRLMWGWVWDHDQVGASHYDVGGLLTVPRQLTYADGRVQQWPVQELGKMRGPELLRLSDVGLNGSQILVEKTSWSWDAEFTVSQLGDTLEIVFCADSASSERTRLIIEHSSVVLDTMASSLADGPARGRYTCPAHWDASGRLDIRLLVDGSVVEVFAGGEVITARLYPTRETSQQLRVASRAPATLAAKVWAIEESFIDFANHASRDADRDDEKFVSSTEVSP